jgi:tetratricopeptide (TPR) repeat protein
MAQLHGRIFGLSDRRGRVALALAWAAAVGLTMAGGAAARAQAVGELRRAAADLRSEEGAAREKAFGWLSQLGEGALPAVRDRVGELGRTPLEPEQARDALYAFRHAVGSRRADDMVDIAPGVLPVLAERRDAVAVGMAERLALARALEAMDTVEAGETLCDLIGREDDPWPWRWEARRMADRMGPRALPVLLVAAGHDSRYIRRWARRGLEALGPPGVGEALEGAEARGLGALAHLLRAWGKARIMDAMPTVVAFVDDPRRRVRAAARDAVEAYGRNIIWQLRRAYRLETGEDANPSWGAQRTRAELYAVVDRARLHPARTSLERGLQAWRAGDLSAMEAHFERALRDAPGEPSIEGPMAAAWAALGDARLDGGDWAAAAQAYRRALWAAPGVDGADGWRARLALAEAEHSLSAGVVDLPGFERAAQDPSLGGATRAVDRLSGAAAARDRARRRYAAALAALLLAFVGFQLLRRRDRPADHDALPPGGEVDDVAGAAAPGALHGHVEADAS